MKPRSPWTERWKRPGWDTLYTVVGGCLADDPVQLLHPSARPEAVRALSQVFVASSLPLTDEVPDFVRHWATVVRKIIQRGTRPVIHHEAASRLMRSARPRPEQVQAAVVGRAPPFELDPAFQLHPVHEEPFWARLGDVWAPYQRWCTPQASLDALIGPGRGAERRWVDFLFHAPFGRDPLVLEVDGSGHERQEGLDRQRDRLLRGQQIRVHRLKGAEVHDPENDWFARLADRRTFEFGDLHTILTVHGPPALQRLAFALVEGVERGFLPPGQPWRINVSDGIGATDRAAEASLDLLASISDVWGGAVVPPEVMITGRSYRRDSTGRFQEVPGGETSPEPIHLRVVLDPFTPPHAALPEGDEAPAIVLRGAFLPVELPWCAPSSHARFYTQLDEVGERALKLFVRDVFGHPGFRQGQKAAITRTLTGGDSCVLLPTGGGKTLIYQAAGLLLPGTTIVVAPLKALIDDQERRLREEGIDRVGAVHSGKRRDRDEKSGVLSAIGNGDALFVLIAPERLQIASFRDSLREASAGTTVGLTVVDEAHCVSEWGHDFRPSYLKLGENLRRFCTGKEAGPPPVLALTATASPHVLRDMLNTLGLDPDEDGVLHRPDTFDRPNLSYRVFRGAPTERLTRFREALHWVAGELGVPLSKLADQKGHETLSGLVFVPDASSGRRLGITHFSEALSRALQVAESAPIAVYAGRRPKELSDEGGLSWEARKADEARAFRENEKPLMVATSAFGMGIDKPNIRFTIHVSLPGSIEAFAQQAGRAGRDGKPSLCALVAALPPPELDAAHHGSGGPTRNAPVAPYPSVVSDTGLNTDRIEGSFPSTESQMTAGRQVLSEVEPDGVEDELVVIPRSISGTRNTRAQESEARSRERVLHRLMVIGAVEDYTVEYGSGAFWVERSGRSIEKMVHSTTEFVRRETANNRKWTGRVEEILTEDERRTAILRLLALVTDVVDTFIKRARLNALREIVDLARLGTDQEGIRSRINAYLGEGRSAALLDKLVADETDIRSTIEALSTFPPANHEEWAGTAARYLESYPDHPVVLGMRALGESDRNSRNLDTFREFVSRMLRTLPEYADEVEERREVLSWLLEHLRVRDRPDIGNWLSTCWMVYEDADAELLAPLEEAVLDGGVAEPFHPLEIECVMAIRLRRAKQTVEPFLDQLNRVEV